MMDVSCDVSDDHLDYFGTAHKDCAVAQPYFRNNVTNQCCELTAEDLEIQVDFGNISVSCCRIRMTIIQSTIIVVS